MAIYINSFADDNNNISYFATAEIIKDGVRYSQSKYFEKGTREKVRHWVRGAETRLMIEHDLSFKHQENKLFQEVMRRIGKGEKYA